jgi:hypothetical protein
MAKRKEETGTKRQTQKVKRLRIFIPSVPMGAMPRRFNNLGNY